MDLRGKHVKIVGDSQADGIDGPLGHLLESAGATVSSSTHTGMSLAQAASLPPSEDADITFVSFGGNNPPATYATAVSQMDALLSKLRGQVYWMTVLPSSDPALQPARARMAAWQKRYLPTRGVIVIDGEATAAGLPRGNDPHLTASGYTALAGRLLAALRATPARAPWLLAIGVGTAIGVGVALARR
jgi:hypothetical protein